MNVRTRFAPSPTGYMHVGNLRTALYAYLLARKHGGTFILRIEDTDQEREVAGAVDIIYSTLRQTGLLWDEGPDKGGPCGPYVQSERKPIYREHADMLVDGGHAYYCFCDKERLDLMRKRQEAEGKQPKYDGHCRTLPRDEREKLIAAGKPWVIRQRIPDGGTTTFKDEVFGEITVENDTLDDNVLLKSDGLPTYNFANVVDDHLMGISHVIRGMEYLSSSPKYNLLYQAFGWDIPKYVHCPPVMRDAQRKLSKRDGDASYQDFIDKGYLNEAVMNYLALLGWNPGTDREKFTLAELAEAFDISGISKSPAIFDPVKLAWLNGEYIRALTPQEFTAKALPFIKQAVKRADVAFATIAAVLQQRTEKLSDIPPQLDFIDALPDYSPEMFIHKKSKTTFESSLASLKAAREALDAIPESGWDHPTLHAALMGLVEKLAVKNAIVLWPLRVALSGKEFTPGGGIEIAHILGRKESLARLEQGISKLETAIGK
ncbi:MAG TPA: glutamate--tRNA ligase [bacterium]|nr:glutamate--tRNA ligase [bacterium]